MSRLRARFRALTGARTRGPAHDKAGDPAARSQIRWRDAKPDQGLTWGYELTGDAFVAKVDSFGGFGPERSILEIGPGYGRLARSAVALGLPFRRYVAVDLSETNVAHLREVLTDPRFEIVCGDAQTVELDERFDTAVSSLTLKHIYPSFSRALGNVRAHLNPGGLVAFDLIEGDGEYFEDDDVTFIRHYSRTEVADMLADTGLTLVAFDQVDHDAEHPGHRRLLVVARAPD
jgi:SAM-dependent methyltransferase